MYGRRYQLWWRVCEGGRGRGTEGFLKRLYIALLQSVSAVILYTVYTLFTLYTLVHPVYPCIPCTL